MSYTDQQVYDNLVSPERPQTDMRYTQMGLNGFATGNPWVGLATTSIGLNIDAVEAYDKKKAYNKNKDSYIKAKAEAFQTLSPYRDPGGYGQGAGSEAMAMSGYMSGNTLAGERFGRSTDPMLSRYAQGGQVKSGSHVIPVKNAGQAKEHARAIGVDLNGAVGQQGSGTVPGTGGPTDDNVQLRVAGQNPVQVSSREVIVEDDIFRAMANQVGLSPEQYAQRMYPQADQDNRLATGGQIPPDDFLRGITPDQRAVWDKASPSERKQLAVAFKRDLAFKSGTGNALNSTKSGVGSAIDFISKMRNPDPTVIAEKRASAQTYMNKGIVAATTQAQPSAIVPLKTQPPSSGTPLLRSDQTFSDPTVRTNKPVTKSMAGSAPKPAPVSTPSNLTPGQTALASAMAAEKGDQFNIPGIGQSKSANAISKSSPVNTPLNAASADVSATNRPVSTNAELDATKEVAPADKYASQSKANNIVAGVNIAANIGMGIYNATRKRTATPAPTEVKPELLDLHTTDMKNNLDASRQRTVNSYLSTTRDKQGVGRDIGIMSADNSAKLSNASAVETVKNQERQVNNSLVNNAQMYNNQAKTAWQGREAAANDQFRAATGQAISQNIQGATGATGQWLQNKAYISQAKSNDELYGRYFDYESGDVDNMDPMTVYSGMYKKKPVGRGYNGFGQPIR